MPLLPLVTSLVTLLMMSPAFALSMSSSSSDIFCKILTNGMARSSEPRSSTPEPASARNRSCTSASCALDFSRRLLPCYLLLLIVARCEINAPNKSSGTASPASTRSRNQAFKVIGSTFWSWSGAYPCEPHRFINSLLRHPRHAQTSR